MSIKSTNGIMVVYRMSSKAGELQSGYLVAYPNPTTGEIKFTFDVKEYGNVKLYITDMSGQLKHLIVGMLK